MAKFRQLKRQRASDVGETTGFGIGNRFGRDHEQIQRMLGHGRPTKRITLWSGRPALQTWCETCLRVANSVPTHGVAPRSAPRDRQVAPRKTPPATRDPGKPETGYLRPHTGLPPSRRFSARQPRPWNQRAVFHAEELHELGMLIRRRSPCPDKRAGGQLMEHQLVRLARGVLVLPTEASRCN